MARAKPSTLVSTVLPIAAGLSIAAVLVWAVSRATKPAPRPGIDYPIVETNTPPSPAPPVAPPAINGTGLPIPIDSVSGQTFSAPALEALQVADEFLWKGQRMRAVNDIDVFRVPPAVHAINTVTQDNAMVPVSEIERIYAPSSVTGTSLVRPGRAA